MIRGLIRRLMGAGTPPPSKDGVDRDKAVLETRLAALELEVRRLRAGDAGAAATDEALRRCADLVSANVPAGTPLAVALADESSVLALDHRPVSPFPPRGLDGGGVQPRESIGVIACLEAQRARETRFLLVPEPAREWMSTLPGFADQLASRYRRVADEPGSGVLFDVGVRRVNGDGKTTLGALLFAMSKNGHRGPVLDWTDLELGDYVPGRGVFAPPPGERNLPYLDETIDVVVVDAPERVEEARRVAREAVVVAGLGETGIEVVDVQTLSDEPPGGPDVVVVVAGDDPDEAWLDRVREAVSEAGRTKVVASSDPLAKAADSEVAVVLEPGVLPLPGCIEILAATLASDDAPPAVTGKLIGATGRLEAAGRIVFADGSVAGMGAGRDALFSPWHEYVRPVCAASGLLAVRGTTAESLRSRSSSLLALSGHLWAQGERLLYQPAACAVSVLDSGDEGTADQSDDGIDAWRKALPARPPRPPQLDERAWREILARDDAREAFE